MDIEKIRDIKHAYHTTYSPKVEAEGYTMALGIGRNDDGFTLEVRLQPKVGSPDPIPADLLERIKNEVLENPYEGTPVNITYVGYKPR